MRSGLMSSRACESSESSLAEALEVGHEQRAVGRAAGRVADRVELQLEAVEQAELAEPGRLQRDHLGVDGRVVGAERLDAELPVLAVAAALGAWRSGTSARRTRASRAAARAPGRARGRRARPAPCPRAAASARGRRGRVNEYISLLTTSEASPEVREKSAVSSNVGVTTWPKPARSKTRTAVSTTSCRSATRGGSQSIVATGARTGSLTGAAPRGRGSAASSSPSVVGSPWPDKTGVSGGYSAISEAMLACRVGQSPSRRSVRPDRPAEEHVAGVERAVDQRTQGCLGSGPERIARRSS